MPETMVCPHCKGSGVNYIVVPGDKPMLEPASCVVCGGSGAVAKPPEPVAPVPLVPSSELWPVLVPLGIFFLFFAFLFV
jgi:hypothetical protein